MKCCKCNVKDAVDPFGDCDDCYEERKRRNAKEYAESLLKISTCSRCKVESMTSYHWCINCFRLWSANGNCFPENKPSNKYMFIDSDDEDEKQIPFAKSPIDEYRGTGKKVNTCRWRCIESQLGGCNCEEKYAVKSNLLQIVQDKLKAFDDQQKVGFGKYRGYKWWDMMQSRETTSWSEWYINNCNNKGKFFNYLVLAKEEDDLKKDIRYITHPSFE